MWHLKNKNDLNFCQIQPSHRIVKRRYYHWGMELLTYRVLRKRWGLFCKASCILITNWGLLFKDEKGTLLSLINKAQLGMKIACNLNSHLFVGLL